MSDEVTVRHQPDSQRFEVLVDEQRAGIAEYVERDGKRAFTHTEVDKAYSGRGLAGRLVGEALDQTVSDGMRIVGICPFVTKYLGEHPEYAEHVDPAEPDLIAEGGSDS